MEFGTVWCLIDPSRERSQPASVGAVRPLAPGPLEEPAMRASRANRGCPQLQPQQGATKNPLASSRFLDFWFSGFLGFWEPGRPGFQTQKSRKPEIQKSVRFLDFRISRKPEISLISGFLVFWISGFLGTGDAGGPPRYSQKTRNPENQKSRKPEIQKSARG